MKIVQFIISFCWLIFFSCLIRQSANDLIKRAKKINLNPNDKTFEKLYDKFHTKFSKKTTYDKDYTFTRCFNETFIESQENIINVEDKKGLPMEKYSIFGDCQNYRYESINCIYGNINDSDFYLSEVADYLKDLIPSVHGDSFYVTKFKGHFGYSILKKNVQLNFQIRIKKLFFKNKKNYLATNNKKFDRYFDVFTNDAQLFNQIFTPVVLNKLITMYEKYNIMYEFILKDNVLYYRFYTNELYGYKVYNHKHEKRELYKAYTKYNYMIEVINYFLSII